ncbi:hypothetical protein [Niveispirillum fermenti]|uniref:hypothetical protein n=1 Tax=Niveispirillum fermenti TaxID=1233113 RepID=UPI003A849C1A
MKNMMKYGRVLALVPLLALAACGGEPSEGEMRDALQAQFDKANKMAAERGVAGFKAVLEKFEKVSCGKTDGSSIYNCTVTIKCSGPMMNLDGTTEMRFSKGGDGWVVVQ